MYYAEAKEKWKVLRDRARGRKNGTCLGVGWSKNEVNTLACQRTRGRSDKIVEGKAIKEYQGGTKSGTKD